MDEVINKISLIKVKNIDVKVSKSFINHKNKTLGMWPRIKISLEGVGEKTIDFKEYAAFGYSVSAEVQRLKKAIVYLISKSLGKSLTVDRIYARLPWKEALLDKTHSIVTRSDKAIRVARTRKTPMSKLTAEWKKKRRAEFEESLTRFIQNRFAEGTIVDGDVKPSDLERVFKNVMDIRIAHEVHSG